MPSSSTVCVRFFSSSSSSSGTKPSVRKRLGGMLATASRWVSAFRKPARSAASNSARLPSCEPLYARRILRYFMRASSGDAGSTRRAGSLPLGSANYIVSNLPPMLDIQRPDLVAGVAGSGTMGRGIVQVLAQCGVRTLVFDAKPGAAQTAKDAVAKSLTTLVQKGRVQQADADAAVARIEVVDALAALKPCHVVLEAIIEALEPKQALFRELEGIVAASCILASNTSSLSVTAMASA